MKDSCGSRQLWRVKGSARPFESLHQVQIIFPLLSGYPPRSDRSHAASIIATPPPRRVLREQREQFFCPPGCWHSVDARFSSTL